MVRRVLTGVLVAWCLGGLVWGVGQWLRWRPSLEDAIALAEAGRLDEAEARLRARLAVDPNDEATHLLLAQVAVRRLDAPEALAGRSPEDWARLALDHLDRVHTSDPNRAVMLQVCRGRALHRLLRLEEAEAAWLEALRISPTAPEAGWHLLELYYVQGRQEEARRLALRLHELEPDAHDRVRLLVELLRLDARPPAPGSVAMLLEPVVRRNPHDLHSSIALGLALVRNGELDRGMDLLRRTLDAHPESPAAWEAWLTGLDDGGRLDELGSAVGRIPPALATDPRFARFRGRVAQERQDWKVAAQEYRRGLRHDPHDAKLRYRLARALRQVGATAEAEPLDREHQAYQAALDEARPLYEEVIAIPTLGVRPHSDLYRRLADHRERMGQPDEARAWYRLVLADRPDDPAARAALERLGRADPRGGPPDAPLAIRSTGSRDPGPAAPDR
jgi:tetratricopeptide (TPR) repeat protein